jgi:hypothetical protein
MFFILPPKSAEEAQLGPASELFAWSTGGARRASSTVSLLAAVPKFPPVGSEFIDSGLGGAPTSAKKVVKPEPYGLIPCASKQGFLACRELKSTIREISALIRECRSRPLFGRSIRYSRENSNLAEKGKEGRRQMLAWPHQTSGSSEVWRKPPVRYVASMSRNRLTRPSNSDRTYQEHKKSADDGSGVGC